MHELEMQKIETEAQELVPEVRELEADSQMAEAEIHELEMHDGGHCHSRHLASRQASAMRSAMPRRADQSQVDPEVLAQGTRGSLSWRRSHELTAHAWTAQVLRRLAGNEMADGREGEAAEGEASGSAASTGNEHEAAASMEESAEVTLETERQVKWQEMQVMQLTAEYQQENAQEEMMTRQQQLQRNTRGSQQALRREAVQAALPTEIEFTENGTNGQLGQLNEPRGSAAWRQRRHEGGGERSQRLRLRVVPQRERPPRHGEGGSAP